ncbi:MAG: hypothetical protein KIT69_17690, partial [Propionibacteriaceae bacterium]|nr:hypothetical protein [Propionibacteriaceae bacterium]
DESAALAALTTGTAIPADLRQIVVSYPNLRPAVAAYPGTDEAMLGWLRDLHDPAVDTQLAARSRPAEPAPTAPQATSAAAATGSPSPAPVGEDGPAHPTSTAGPASQPAPANPRPMAQSAPSPTAPGGAPAPATAGGPVPASAPAEPTGTSIATPGYGPPGPLAVGPPGPPAFTPTPPSPAAGGGGPGARIVLIAVVALLIVGGGVFAAFAAGLVPGFGSSPAPAPTLAPPSPDGEQPSEEPPATTPTPIAPTPITPTPIVPPSVGFACWDTSEADSLAACPTPQSREQAWQYLRYVYPSLARHNSCKQSDSTGKSDYQGVTVMWECELGDSLLRYRYWVDPSDAERHYGRKFKDSTAGTYDVAIGGQAVEGWVKTSEEAIAKQTDGSKRYVATMWLPELQLSMSAEGNDTTAMWNAFELVRVRPLEQVNGHQLGSNPSEVPLTIAER